MKSKWIWIVIGVIVAATAAYFLFFRKKNKGSAPIGSGSIQDAIRDMPKVTVPEVVNCADPTLLEMGDRGPNVQELNSKLRALAQSQFRAIYPDFPWGVSETSKTGLRYNRGYDNGPLDPLDETQKLLWAFDKQTRSGSPGVSEFTPETMGVLQVVTGKTKIKMCDFENWATS